MTGFIFFETRDRILSLSRSLLGALGYGPSDAPPTSLEEVTDATRADLREADLEGRWLSLYLHRKDGNSIPASGRLVVSGGGEGSLLELEWEDSGGQELAGGPAAVDTASLNFLTTVSHELRVSLNGVIGFSNLLASGELGAEQRETLGKLQSCNLLLKGLVNDILEYSRVVTSNLEMALESVRVAAFAREVCSLFSERAKRKGLELELHCSVPEDRRVELPKIRVTQVLSNLISNAIKFTDAGSVSLRCAIDGDALRFEVEDSGRGIPLAQSGKIFRPFVQLSSRAGAQEGSGLGLAISKSLAERMGGRLGLERSSASGSVFVFSLPIKRPASAEPQPSALDRAAPGGEAPAPEAGPRPPRRVLVVEDNQLNADILRHFLRDYGVAFDVVDTGRLAVDTYSDGKYDLILMDVMLPELNGYEATEQILAASKRQPPVPIIGVTAKVFRRDQRRCIECGMVDVVHKPVDFKLLRRVLDRHLYGIGAASEPGPFASDEPFETRQVPLFDGPFRRDVLEDYIERMKSSVTSREEVFLSAIKIVDTEVDRLLAAIELGENAEVSMRAHSLKGALALLGARDLLDLVKALEAQASQEGATIRTEHWCRLIYHGYVAFKQAALAYLGLETI